MLAGLATSGVDVTGADLVVGTSAGATAGAQLTGSSPSRLFADILDAHVPLPARAAARQGSAGSGSDHLRRLRETIAGSADAADMRRRIGDLALAADADTSERWRDIVAARLTSHRWPAKRLLITAVDARTGDPVAFERSGGVDLVDAVAASTAGGGFAYRIGADRYIDGGYRRSSENADLAIGAERVLVLSPLGGRVLTPPEWGTPLEVQVDELTASGSAVETILPDDASLAAFGDNMMDMAARVPAALAGFEQGRTRAEALSSGGFLS